MTDNQKTPSGPDTQEIAPDARRIMRMATKISLATLDEKTGAPFISLTGVATDFDATPILLLSGLARHTRNIAKDPRASLLFESAGTHANPLTASRVSISGEIMLADEQQIATRFQNHQPKTFYAEFGDFNFYSVKVSSAHYIGGFGVAVRLTSEQLLFKGTDIEELAGAEQDILAHMNADHLDAISLCAVKLCGADDGPWKMSSLDPEGCELTLKTRRVRLDFPQPVLTVDDTVATLAGLAHEARKS